MSEKEKSPMVTVGTKITREEREAFDKYCKENDITMS
jgi:hypothetical protein